ncbi:MICOS complex subunit MIC13 homolog QIL1-like [Drosophila madeirensis]|uniref:MICOS complex subunit MIC13 n=2 Tax=Drosophila madeirensis TaxID=30013 RepID=A0AAU9FFK6_DROMD
MVLMVIAKLGVVAGVAFATKQLGVWESPEHSAVLLENARESLRPYAQDLKDRICCWKCQEKCMEEFEPKPWRESFVDSWNDTIKKAFHFLNQVPTNFHHFMEDVEKAVTDLVKEKDQKIQKVNPKQTSCSKMDKTSAKSN